MCSAVGISHLLSCLKLLQPTVNCDVDSHSNTSDEGDGEATTQITEGSIASANDTAAVRHNGSTASQATIPTVVDNMVLNFRFNNNAAVKRRPKFGISNGTDTKHKKENLWNLKADLYEMLKLVSSYNKLACTARPNTSPIGNSDIIRAIEKVSQLLDIGSLLQAKLLMGRKTSVKSSIDIPLNYNDDDATIDRQWSLLK